MSSSKYIVRQPIKDPENHILGYEIQYYGENYAFSGGDPQSRGNEFAAADTIYNFLTLNTDKLLRGSLNFMTFTTTLLMKKTPRLFDKGELVIQIDDSVIIHPLAMHMINQYAKEGYQIAINEFQFAPRYLAIMDSIDYIKLNFRDTPEMTLKNIIEIAHSMNKKCIAVNIDREELYQWAIKLKVDAMEGTFVAEKMTTKTHNSGYMQSNFFRLMVAVLRDEPDVEEIEQIISVDATLAYGLLKIANSRYFSLRSKVTTVRQAIMTVGLNELKQWVYLLSASNAENPMDEGAEEFLRRLGEEFPSVILRPTGVYGPREKDYYLMARSVQRHVDVGAGLRPQVLTFVYADDVVQAAGRALTAQVPSASAYDLSDGGEYSSSDFSRLLRRELRSGFLLRLRLPLWLLRAASACAEGWSRIAGRPSTLNLDKYQIMKQRSWRCDIGPARRDLGYSPRYPLPLGVKKTVEWYKKEGWL